MHQRKDREKKNVVVKYKRRRGRLTKDEEQYNFMRLLLYNLNTTLIRSMGVLESTQSN